MSATLPDDWILDLAIPEGGTAIQIAHTRGVVRLKVHCGHQALRPAMARDIARRLMEAADAAEGGS